MKKTFCIGLVCVLVTGVALNVSAQEKKKAADAAHEHDKKEHAHDKEHKHEDEKSHEHKDEKAHAHPEEAPHGGTVVKLGKHGFILEFVRDPDAGKFQVFVLNGHMEYVEVPENAFDLVAKVQGKEHRLTFNRAKAAGEDKSSTFEGSADWIKTTKKFEGSIPEITLKGKTFTNVSFAFPTAKKAHKH
jgi:hypothetical protein